MFFRKRHVPVIDERPAFVHRLSDEEMRNRNLIDIEHIGAVSDINLVKKEDALMVEKLKAYRAELVAKAEALKTTDDSVAIDAKVVAYKDQLIAEAKAEREKELAKIDSDINCIDNIIAREEEAAAAVEAPLPTDAVSE